MKNKEIENCTFKPQTNLNTSRQREKSVFEELYDLKDKKVHLKGKDFIQSDFEN